MTRYLADHATYQGDLRVADYARAGFTIVNWKLSHGLTDRAVRPEAAIEIASARAQGIGISTFHFLTGDASGYAQARRAFERMISWGAVDGCVHVVDVETNTTGPDATLLILRDYIAAMQGFLGRKIMVYTGDWWWQPKGWDVSDLTPYLHAAPNAGYPGSYPGDTATAWRAGWAGWKDLTAMQYAVAPLTYPGGGTSGDIKVSKSAVRDPAAWSALAGGEMASWILVPSLVSLRGEFNAIAPGRDRSSDGSIGDSAHADSVSDHNPDETGNTGGVEDSDSINEVHAIDVDMSGPWPSGFSMERAVQFLVAECRAGRERRLRYIIFNRRIWSASNDWAQRDYSGSNPHDKHAHFSASYVTAQESDTSSWGLREMAAMATLDSADKTWLKSSEFTGAMVAAFNAALRDSDSAFAGIMKAITWQYVGGGLPAGVSALGALNSTVGSTAAIAALRAENATLEAGTAGLVNKLTELITDAGGDVDSAPILASIEQATAQILAASREAGQQAADRVLAEVRKAAEAEAAALSGGATA